MQNQEPYQVISLGDLQSKTIQDTMVLAENSNIYDQVNGIQFQPRNTSVFFFHKSNAIKHNASLKKEIPVPVKRGSNPKRYLHRSERNASLTVLDDNWNLWNERLEMYRQLHGNCDVPKDYIDSEGFKLGEWVYKLKSKIKELPPRKRRMANVNSSKFWGSIYDDCSDSSGNMMSENDLSYHQKHGNTRVPCPHVKDADNRQGGSVSTQRQGLPAKFSNSFLPDEPIKNKKMSNSVLSDEPIKKLESTQSKSQARASITSSWDAMFERLLLYRQKHGSTGVPKRYVDEEGYKLGSWIKSQRHALPKKRNTTLRDERMKKLNSIQFKWKSYNTHLWMDMFKHLLMYLEEYGNTRVPFRYVNRAGKKLGEWVFLQRSILPTMSESIVRDDQIQKLNIINFDWDFVES